MTATFAREIQKTATRMQSNNERNVRAMLKLGMPFAKARHYEGGPVVTTVVVHESWKNTEAWRNCQTIAASLPEDN